MESAVLFGAMSVAFMAASRLLYLYSIVRGKTRPHVFSWLIWATISAVGFAAQFVEGAGPGAWARGFGALSCFLIMLLAFRHGEKNITRADFITLLIALATIPLWIATETPFWSVVVVCCIDTLGYLPTVRKSWRKPQEELPVGYLVSSLGAACSLIAIEQYVPSTWLYPAVLVLSNATVFAYLMLRRRRLEVQP